MLAVWFPGKKPPDPRFQAPDPGQEKFNSRPVLPTWNISGSLQQLAASRFFFGASDLRLILRPVHQVQTAGDLDTTAGLFATSHCQ